MLTESRDNDSVGRLGAVFSTGEGTRGASIDVTVGVGISVGGGDQNRLSFWDFDRRGRRAYRVCHLCLGTDDGHV